MIDMNQSIENIMEQSDRIAFNEFKSDVDLYYKQRRAAEHQSGMHDKRGVMNYKSRSEKTRDYGTGANMGYRNKSDEIPRNAEDKKYIDYDNKDSSRSVDSAASLRKMQENIISCIRKRQRKVLRQ